MRRALAVAAATAALCGAAAVPAAAERGRLADFTLRLSSTAPDTPSGMAVDIVFHRENDPDAKPSALESAVLRGPAGLRFDTTTRPECMATDEELRALGAEACPDETRLTVGRFSAMTGFPADLPPGDLHVFNGPDQLIEVITGRDGSASPAFDRITIEGSTLTAHPPDAPGGPPEFRTSVRALDYRIPVLTRAAKALIRTPPTCPAEGRWTTVATFGFFDGTTDTVASRTPCKRPKLRLAVSPRHVRAGRAARFGFRVTSTSDDCVEDATVRIGGRGVPVDERGRAALTTTLNSAGLPRARATSPGCRPASVPVRVLP